MSWHMLSMALEAYRKLTMIINMLDNKILILNTCNSY